MMQPAVHRRYTSPRRSESAGAGGPRGAAESALSGKTRDGENALGPVPLDLLWHRSSGGGTTREAAWMPAGM